MGNIVNLRNTPIDLNSDVGHAFVVDATRAAEGLLTDKELAEKYELSPKDWQAITKEAPRVALNLHYLISLCAQARALHAKSGVHISERRGPRPHQNTVDASHDALLHRTHRFGNIVIYLILLYNFCYRIYCLVPKGRKCEISEQSPLCSLVSGAAANKVRTVLNYNV